MMMEEAFGDLESKRDGFDVVRAASGGPKGVPGILHYRYQPNTMQRKVRPSHSYISDVQL